MFHDRRHDGDLAAGSKDAARAAAGSRFGLTETEVGDGCREIKVEGELDLAVSDRLQRAIAACQSNRILIDLESCRFIDSTAIALIVKAHCEGNSRVVVHSPRDQVLRVLEITGLTGNGIVFADREQALLAVVGSGSS
jgi:anti-anti-sigma factor